MEKEINSKDEEIKNLKNELEFLKGQILNKNRKIFGASSEQVDADQLSLFNEAEKYSDSKVEEPTLEEITYRRAKKSNYTGKIDNLANLERVIIEHKLEDHNLKCKECGETLKEIVQKSKKEIIKYIPAKFIIEEHIMYSYSCKSCEKETGESNIVSTKAPSTVFYNSMASHELIAHTLVLKYQHAMPLYRHQIYFDMLGASISRQTLCNWTMAAAKVLEPIYTHMKKNFLFSITTKGATSSANIYSIVETAKANKLVVEKYLVYLFDNLSKLDIPDDQALEDLMPWSIKIPQNMKVYDKN